MNRTCVDSDLIKQAVAVASRAPSLHNSQPWSWLADGPELQLHLDRSRIVAHADPCGREALIGCGAMLDHLRTAMASSGWESFVDRFPNPNDPIHLASVDLRRAAYVTTATRARATAMLRRRTDRLPFLPPNDWPAVESSLRALVDTSWLRLEVLPDELRDDLVEVSKLTETLRRYDWGYISELDWWTTPFELDDGLPRRVLNSVAEADRVDVNRRFPSQAHAERRKLTGRDQARIIALSTPDDTRGDALAAGEALSIVLLECTAGGLATCTVSHLTEVPSSRSVLATLLNTTWQPQVLIRVGRIPALDHLQPATPRRPLSDILRFRR